MAQGVLAGKSPAAAGARLGLEAGSLSLGDEVAVRLRFAEDTAHLHRFLEAAQQGILAFAITDTDF